MLVLMGKWQTDTGNAASTLCLVSVKSIVYWCNWVGELSDIINGVPKNEFCCFATLKSVPTNSTGEPLFPDYKGNENTETDSCSFKTGNISRIIPFSSFPPGKFLHLANRHSALHFPVSGDNVCHDRLWHPLQIE